MDSIVVAIMLAIVGAIGFVAGALYNSQAYSRGYQDGYRYHAYLVRQYERVLTSRAVSGTMHAMSSPDDD